MCFTKQKQMYVLSSCFRVHYTVNWAPLFLAVFPSHSIYVNFYIGGPNKHYSLYRCQQNILQAHKIYIVKQRTDCSVFSWFPFQVAHSQRLRKYKDDISLLYFRQCEIFFLNEQMSIIKLRWSKKRDAIMLIKYIIIHFCNVCLRAKDACYLRYFWRTKIPLPTKFLQFASQEIPKYSLLTWWRENWTLLCL